MVKERMDLLELLHKGGMDGVVDFPGGSESAGRGDHGCGGHRGSVLSMENAALSG